jgi:rhamnosyltransferase
MEGVAVGSSVPNRVVAVVVSHNPDGASFVEALASIVSQVAHVVVVDNGSRAGAVEAGKQFARLCPTTMTWVALGENLGVAAGQNIGYRRAIERNCEYVVFFDQDSVPDDGMIAALWSAAERLRDDGRRVAAVGPRYRDPRRDGALSFFVTIRHFRTVPVPHVEDIVETDFLVSSGMLVPAEAMEAIGLMDEGLFVDHVDTEWCLRARSLGYRTFGVHSACMTHTLGAKRVALPLSRTRTLVVHKPERYYFMVRNSLLLLRRGYTYWGWRIFELRRLTRLFVLYGVLLPGRSERLAWMARGVLHGVLGRTGPIRA